MHVFEMALKFAALEPERWRESGKRTTNTRFIRDSRPSHTWKTMKCYLISKACQSIDGFLQHGIRWSLSLKYSINHGKNWYWPYKSMLRHVLANCIFSEANNWQCCDQCARKKRDNSTALTLSGQLHGIQTNQKWNWRATVQGVSGEKSGI